MESTKRRDFLGAATALVGAGVLGGAASGCAGSNQSVAGPGEVWQDASRSNRGVEPRYRVTPNSLADLVGVVQKAERAGLTVRMTGSGHSYSDVAFSDGYLLNPGGMSAPLALPKEQLRDAAKGRLLFRTESGATIRDLNEELDCAGLAFRNLGGYNAQTIVGAAMTATHGSGLKYGPITSQIVSLQLVVAGGEVLQVEPTNGITDPQRFPGYIISDGKKIPAKLVQEDGFFNATNVSMGAMGVIYAVVLEAVPAFWLQESPRVTDWGHLTCSGGFIERLLSGKPLADNGPQPEYYEVSLNPYPSARGGGAKSHQCLLQQRYRLENEPWRSPADRKRGKLGAFLDGAGTVASGHGKLLVDLVNRFPEQAPMVITESIKSRADRSYIAKSYEVFNIGAVNHMRVFGIEMAVELSQVTRLTERFFEIAKEYYERGIVHTTPCTLRFVKGSPLNLAMMYGRDTCTLEIGSVLGVRGSRELLLGYQQRLMAEFGARPHWGLDLNSLQSIDAVRGLWGRENVDDWLKVYRSLNRSGVFNGALTERLGISV